jgi:hypothetical protein
LKFKFLQGNFHGASKTKREIEIFVYSVKFFKNILNQNQYHRIMEISIYFSYCFVSLDSKLYKVDESSEKPSLIQSSVTTPQELINQGWRLAHAIKTAQSAQMESFNFLLVFEK